MFRAYFMRISAWIQLKKHNSGDNMEICQWKHRFSRIMLQRCSNPEIRAEQGGFSALDQVNNKVTPARLSIAYLPTRPTYNRLIARNIRKNGETRRWWPSIPKYHYSAPENSQRQGWTKIGKLPSKHIFPGTELAQRRNWTPRLLWTLYPMLMITSRLYTVVGLYLDRVICKICILLSSISPSRRAFSFSSLTSIACFRKQGSGNGWLFFQFYLYICVCISKL